MRGHVAEISRGRLPATAQRPLCIIGGLSRSSGIELYRRSADKHDGQIVAARPAAFARRFDDSHCLICKRQCGLKITSSRRQQRLHGGQRSEPKTVRREALSQPWLHLRKHCRCTSEIMLLDAD